MTPKHLDPSLCPSDRIEATVRHARAAGALVTVTLKEGGQVTGRVKLTPRVGYDLEVGNIPMGWEDDEWHDPIVAIKLVDEPSAAVDSKPQPKTNMGREAIRSVAVEAKPACMSREAILEVARRALDNDLRVRILFQPSGGGERRTLETWVNSIDHGEVPINVSYEYEPGCYYMAIHSDGHDDGIVTIQVLDEVRGERPAVPVGAEPDLSCQEWGPESKIAALTAERIASLLSRLTTKEPEPLKIAVCWGEADIPEWVPDTWREYIMENPHDYCGHLVILWGDGSCQVECDGTEPEDSCFRRSWAWVEGAISRAYAEGVRAGREVF